MLSSLRENIASVASVFSLLWYSFVQHKACVCWLCWHLHSAHCFILYFLRPLLWYGKHDKYNLNHIFIYSVWNYESIHFSKYTPYGYMYFFLNTLRLNVAVLQLLVTLSKFWYYVLVNVIYLFVYFYFPFPLFYFHWVLWIYSLKHIFMYCVPNFVDHLLPLCMVETLRAGLMRSQEQTSTTPPQKT